MTTRSEQTDERDLTETTNGKRRWTYRTIFGGMGAQEAARRLNSLGEDGWELVAVVPPHNPNGETVLYLKRPEQMM